MLSTATNRLSTSCQSPPRPPSRRLPSVASGEQHYDEYEDLFDPFSKAGWFLADPDFGLKNGVHLNALWVPQTDLSPGRCAGSRRGAWFEDAAVSKEWWQAELPEIEGELRSYVAHRLPSRRGEHDDLVNATLLSLSEWLRRHKGKPLATTVHPSGDGERRALSALAKVILKRRIADRFRLDSREWRRRVDLGDDILANFPAETAPIERTVLHRQMLEITIGVLATMTTEDRDLIAFGTAARGGERALNPRERQRLRRARRRIADAIVGELGETAAVLLRDDE